MPSCIQESSTTPAALFVENRGQWDDPVRFVGWFGDLRLRAEKDAIVLDLEAARGSEVGGATVRLRFEGVSLGSTVAGEDESEAKFAFFSGNDHERWRSCVPAFSRLRWNDLYEGIDLVLHYDRGALEYDLELAPGADLSLVRVAVLGAVNQKLGEDGSLSIPTAAGDLLQRAPRTFEVDSEGRRHALRSEVVLVPGGFGFQVEDWDRANALVVDPELHWSTYLGSTTNPHGPGDGATAVEFGPGGDVYVTGLAAGPDFPISPGVWSAEGPEGMDHFVARFRGKDGGLVYCTVFGGHESRDGQGDGQSERASDLAVDESGAVTVVGMTDAGDFPTTPGAFQRDWSGPRDAFVLRLSPLGDQLVFSTLLGGAWHDEATSVALAVSGAVVVGGSTTGATDFPTTQGAYQREFDGTGGMGFISRLSPDGSSLEWSTYLGGSHIEFGVSDLELDELEQPTAVGVTTSQDFPVTLGTWNPSPGVFQPLYVTRLNSRGSDLVWSTTFGGSNMGNTVEVTTLSLEPGGGVVVGCHVNSDDFPVTPDAFQTEPSTDNEIDGFVIRLLPDGSDAVYSTRLISPEFGSRIRGVDVDASGVATVVGEPPRGFPTTPGAYDTTFNYEGGFVARLDPRGQRLLYSTRIGSSGPEWLFAGVDITPTRRVTFGGQTAGGWPVTEGAYDETYNGGQTDAMITVMDLLLTGVEEVGESSPACRGPLAAGVTRAPVAGADDFGVYCSGAPPETMGFFLAGQPGFRAIGELDLWVEKPWLRRVVFSDSDGWAEAVVPLPALSSFAAGFEFACQFIFQPSDTCEGPERRSTSNALVIKLR